ncbi:hypothetical protein TNCV_1046051, partial [Trichonephila clavipes]
MLIVFRRGLGEDKSNDFVKLAHSTGGKIMEEDRIESERLKSKLIETEARYRHLESMYDSREKDLSK